MTLIIKNNNNWFIQGTTLRVFQQTGLGGVGEIDPLLEIYQSQISKIFSKIQLDLENINIWIKGAMK